MFILSSPTELSAVPTAVPDRSPTHRVACLGGGLTVVAAAVVLTGPVAVLVGAHVIAAAAAVVDVRSRRLPNHLVAFVAITGVLGVAAASQSAGFPAAAGAAALGALLLGGPMFLIHVAAPSAIGFGDVKLGAALGSVLGPLDPRLGLVALCIATGTTACVGLVTHRRELPLGPGLVLGSVLATALFAGGWS